MYYHLFGTNIDRGFGFNTYTGAETKLINCVIHDQSYASGFWSGAHGGEMYGCIVYHNGWEGPNSLQGTGCYMQNATGVKRITDNIFFNNGRRGTNISGSQNASVRNVELNGNAYFNNGNNLFIGTYGDPADRPLEGFVIRDNYFYRGFVWFGYQNSRLSNAIVERNWIVRNGPGQPVIRVDNAAGSTELFEEFRDNVVFGLLQGIEAESYPENTWLTGVPDGEAVFIRPNQYEWGRANIIIYNWEQKNAIAVDLSEVDLSDGDTFEVRDVQNYFGPPILLGIYCGDPVSIPMAGGPGSADAVPNAQNARDPCSGPYSPAAAASWSRSRLVPFPMTNSAIVPALVEPPNWRFDPDTGIPRPHTAPEFAVFVVRTTN